MEAKLIADAGSTKIEWAYIDDHNPEGRTFRSEGVNALLATRELLTATLRQALSNLPDNAPIDEIHYYGAGCATPQICEKVADVLKSIWTGAAVEVNSDLLAAARSLLGRQKGVACILGTGSNSCMYDGQKIVSQIPSLGFILGDEGSGAALGKRLLADAFKQQLPDTIREKFLAKFGLDLKTILDQVYRMPKPNSFLASLVPFLNENIFNPYVYSLILEEFTSFIKRNVAMYRGAHTAKICFTGSIASVFEKILREAAASQGYSVHTVTASPMPGLVKFHTVNN